MGDTTHQARKRISGLWLLYLLALAACRPMNDPIPAPTPLTERVDNPTTAAELPTATAVVESPIVTAVVPTSTIPPTEPPATDPPPPSSKSLVICQAAEPFTLYPYGTTMLVADNVRHAIYENLYTSLGYAYQPQGLVKLPSLADGDAQIVTVVVNEGERVVDAAGNVVTLAVGTEIIAADGQKSIYNGQPSEMSQMLVDFTLRPLVWSDGTPVTAADSVYSFQLANEPTAEVNQQQLARTAVYETTGDLSVRWTGLPGWLDPTYFLNVWSPLPQHHLGDILPEQLGEHEASARRPLSSGPFVVTDWIHGESIQLARNPHYYRSSEGLPAVDEVTFRFLYDSGKLLTALLAGECHVAFKDGLQVNQATVMALQAAESDGLLIPYFTTGPTFEHLTFNIAPVAGSAESRPNWFTDVRVRQALAMCTDRQQIVNEALFGASKPFAAYVPADHPLYPADLTTWPYDVAAANTLLDGAGYLDQDGDGLREDPASGTPFQVTLSTTSNYELRSMTADIVRRNWADCGVALEISLLPAEEFFAENQEGPLSGRHFDVAMFSWLTGVQPPCQLYTTAEIPHEREDGMWAGFNFGGWSHEGFDVACEAARDAFVDSETFTSHHQKALRLVAIEVPVIPLYARVWVTAARADVIGFMPDPTQPSELWNLYALDLTGTWWKK